MANFGNRGGRRAPTRQTDVSSREKVVSCLWGHMILTLYFGASRLVLDE